MLACSIFADKNGNRASFYQNWRRRWSERCSDAPHTIPPGRNFLHRAWRASRVPPIYWISHRSLVCNYFSRENSRVVFNFVLDWSRLRWILGSFLRQIFQKERTHWYWTGNIINICIYIYDRHFEGISEETCFRWFSSLFFKYLCIFLSKTFKTHFLLAGGIAHLRRLVKLNIKKAWKFWQ